MGSKRERPLRRKSQTTPPWSTSFTPFSSPTSTTRPPYVPQASRRVRYIFLLWTPPIFPRQEIYITTLQMVRRDIPKNRVVFISRNNIITPVISESTNHQATNRLAPNKPLTFSLLSVQRHHLYALSQPRLPLPLPYLSPSPQSPSLPKWEEEFFFENSSSSHPYEYNYYTTTTHPNRISRTPNWKLSS